MFQVRDPMFQVLHATILRVFRLLSWYLGYLPARRCARRRRVSFYIPPQHVID
jgi:hypothetical protein